jgi:DNA-binding GntR family transcriptional regulator
VLERDHCGMLVLSRHHPRQTNQARAALDHLRTLVTRLETGDNDQANALLREADAIELELVFPADPFMR